MDDSHDTTPAPPAPAAPPAAPHEEDHGLEAVLEEDPVLAPSPPFTDSYGLVLVLLVASFFATAVSGDQTYGRALSLLLLASTTWLALRASKVQRRVLRYAMAIIPVLTLVAIVLAALGSDETARLTTATLTALLVLVAPWAIVRRLASHPVVNLNTFYGAICVYLLIAMFFASTFAFSGAVGGKQFFAQVQPPQKATSIDYLYFSFTTITTVGYGDLTAKQSVGRMLAVFEAVLGQLYLITVVALVVQNLGQARKLRKRDP